MDTVSIPQGWVNALGVALLGLFGWLVRKFITKVDKLAEAQKSFVTRNELKDALAEERAVLMDMHKENLSNFREIRMSTGEIDKKLFELALQKKPA